MTITELIKNFRAGLLGILPSVEKINMPWRPGDAYDEWDELAEKIYYSLVVWPILWSLPEQKHKEFKIPRYNLILPSYKNYNIIEVIPTESNDIVKVFHSFANSKNTFDIVKWRAIKSSGLPASEKLGSIPIDSVNFSFRIFTGGKFDKRIEKIIL